MRAHVLLLLSVFASCRCPSTMTSGGLDPVRVSPGALTFESTIIGTSRAASVVVTNPNRFEVSPVVAVDGPFTAELAPPLAPAESREVVVRFTPTAVGAVAGALHVDDQVVALSGEGVAAPVCVAPSVCEESRLDAVAMQCVVSTRPDGAACANRCVEGSCTGGACVGRVVQTCDDHDACTLDACDERLGCVSSVLRCPPPASPCRIATCDTSRGCLDEEAPDGTLCGTDDCLASTVDVCIAGQCVNRPRPATARCENTWAPLTRPSLQPSAFHRLVFDEARSQLLAVVAPGRVGADLQTWWWDGARWSFRLPVRAPVWGGGFAVAWNPARQRVMFVAVEPPRAPMVMEWDGRTWVDVFTTSPPSCSNVWALAAEPGGQAMLLACGGLEADGGFTNQLWRGAGARWARLQSGATAFGFLEDRSRHELLTSNDPTARWDGSRFVELDAGDLPSVEFCNATDPVTTSPVRFAELRDGGFARFGWTGDSWRAEPVGAWPGPRACASAFDATRRVSVFGAGWSHPYDETWTWSASGFVRSDEGAPTFGGALVGTDTAVQFIPWNLPDVPWTWNGRGWSRAASSLTAASVVRDGVFDRDANRVVLVGLDSTSGSAVWSLDAGTLIPLPTVGLPAQLISPRLSWSPAQHRLVLDDQFDDLDQVWSFDGVQWVPGAVDAGFGDRVGGALVTDRLGAVLSLGGWRRGASPGVAETTRWNGAQVTSLPPMPADFDSNTLLAATYDPLRRVTVVVSSARPDGRFLTAEWDGATWQLRSPASSPPAAFVSGLAFDPVSQRVLVVFTDGATWAWLP